MFRIHMLPAGRGDSFLVEYGHREPFHRILIDGGIHRAHHAIRRQIAKSPNLRLELVVVTHADLDHIAGILQLLQDPMPGLEIGDVWFNGWQHIEPEEERTLGLRQGDQLSDCLLRHRYPWNGSFNGAAAVAEDPAEGLLVIDLEGGMRLTLLAPLRKRLKSLARVWRKELERAGLSLGSEPEEVLDLVDDEQLRGDLLLGDEGGLDFRALSQLPFREDRSVANGSSIAFLAEYDGKRCLFSGDAHPSDLERGLRQLAAREGRDALAIDVMKVSHHGGHKSTSPGLLDAIACQNFLFSSDGSVYRHPQPETIARIVFGGRRRGNPRLWFNYRSAVTRLYDASQLNTIPEIAYEAVYPSPGREGVVCEP